MKNLLILTLIFITSYITGFSQEYISTKRVVIGMMLKRGKTEIFRILIQMLLLVVMLSLVNQSSAKI